jgi:hypothetical protein
MPASSQKQARYFQLVRAVQKGKVPAQNVSPKLRKTAKNISATSARDFTKLKEILDHLCEAEYSPSKMKEVDPNKTFDQVLKENVGLPFNKNELISFQEKQIGFGGFGKINFVHKKSTNEIIGELSSNESNKIFVFKKLSNNKHDGMRNYACFIEIRSSGSEIESPKIIYALSTIFDEQDSDKTKVLTDFIDKINSYEL